MTRRVASMNLAQQHALTSAGPDGRLTVTDRRVIGGLIRRGWVQAVDERVRRRTVTRYMITERGRDALNTVPVVQPRPRPMWRDHWDVTPVVVGWCYVVDGHKLIRPGRDMLWRVLCPSCPIGRPVAYCETLTDAVEVLCEHLIATRCPRTPDTVPYDPTELDRLDDTVRDRVAALLDPVDLDPLTEQTRRPRASSDDTCQLGLF
ncbi:hypothetical protein GCM10029964_092780 [Kibdelosporangium lantanae]